MVEHWSTDLQVSGSIFGVVLCLGYGEDHWLDLGTCNYIGIVHVLCIILFKCFTASTSIFLSFNLLSYLFRVWISNECTGQILFGVTCPVYRTLVLKESIAVSKIKGAPCTWRAHFHGRVHNVRKCAPSVCTFFEIFIIAIYWEGAWSNIRVHSLRGSAPCECTK